MIQNPQLYPQQAVSPNASAVNIQIFNPQAYSSPNGQYATMPQDLDRQIYNYQQASLYQPMPQQIMQNPWQPPYFFYMPMPQPVLQPAPQPMPRPVLQPAPQPPMPKPVIKEEEQTQDKVEKKAEVVPQKPEMNEVATNDPVVPQNTVNLNALNAALQNDDLNAQTVAITEVARLSQATPDVALQVVDNQVMQSLVGIIQKDTSALEGPSQQQIQIAEKLSKGEQITAEEKAIFEQGSPKELAEKNKVFAMFALAMLQKLQRDEIDTYNAQDPNAQVAPIKMDELIGHNEIVNTMNETQIPAVKVAAIQSLSYASRPEDKPILETALSKLASDPDPDVQEAVKEAMERVNVQQAAPNIKAE